MTIANTIIVTWKPPVGSVKIQGYLIGWGKNVPDTETVSVNSETFSFTLKNLEPLSEYVITVRAYNQMGQGVPGYVADITEKSIRVKAFAVSYSSINVQWTDESASARSRNRSYSVRFGPRMVDLSQYKEIETNQTSLLIEKLEPFTNYEFSVKAMEGLFESEWSNPAFNTTFLLQPIGAPVDLVVSADLQVNPSRVHVKWKPPKESMGQIGAFDIFYTADASRIDDSWLSVSVDGNSSSTVLSNLQPDTKYFFKVRARDDKLKPGPLSSTVSFRTYPKTINIVISTETFYFASAGCVAFVVLFLTICLCSRCCRSKRAEVEGTTGKSSSTLRNTSGKNKREGRDTINPPDLWIHHDQLDFKSLEKDHSPRGGGTSPVLSTFHEPIQLETSHLEKCKGVVSYAGDSICDEGGQGMVVPSISSTSQSTCFPTALRSTVKSIIIPVTSSTAGGQFNAVVASAGCGLTAALFEPTTGLPRPVYTRSDSLAPNILPLRPGYEGMICNSIQLPYPQPKLVCGNNVPSHSSSGNTSCAMSPTDASSGISSSLTASPSMNNLTLRPLPGLKSLRSFNTLDSYTLPSNTPKHIGECHFTFERMPCLTFHLVLALALPKCPNVQMYPLLSPFNCPLTFCSSHFTSINSTSSLLLQLSSRK